MKNFEEIYEKISNLNFDNLEQSRKNFVKATFIVVIAIFLLFLIAIFFNAIRFLPIIIFPILFIAILIIVLNPNITKYNKLYKNTIISTLINEYDPNLNYEPQQKFPRELYNDAEFERYDIFHSDDYIYGKIDGLFDIQIGDILTEDESTDSDGNTTRYTIFKGIFSAAKLKNISGKIKIRSDKGFLGRLIPNKNLMSMDSQEFEKYFDVYSDNKILAMRILTSDIMDFLIKFKKENNINFEITLKDDKIYIRIHSSTPMFEGSIFKNPLDKAVLAKYYNYLDFICKLNIKIYNILNEKDI
jgi:hypothetical protein